MSDYGATEAHCTNFTALLYERRRPFWGHSRATSFKSYFTEHIRYTRLTALLTETETTAAHQRTTLLTACTTQALKRSDAAPAAVTPLPTLS